ncbi:hypothetical protein ACFQH8_21940 [Halomicroarcula sp. GCM10025710]
MFERLECWASEQPIRQFRGRLANAGCRLLVESGKRNVASESGVEYAVQVILPTIALLIEEFIPSTSLSVDADHSLQQGFLTLAFTLGSKPMQALLRFQWEASEILVGQIYRVDICRNARSEASVHPVGVEFYLTGAFDWLPEFIVFGLGASGE